MLPGNREQENHLVTTECVEVELSHRIINGYKPRLELAPVRVKV